MRTVHKIGKTPADILAAKNSILKTLAYFDIFHYPLLKEEIVQFGGSGSEEYLLEPGLTELIREGRIFLHRDFYSLQNNPLLAHRRRQGNEYAGKLLPKGLRIGRFIYQFPFVRGVAISGSLSKNFANEKADIDFFIIAKANRLWIARTFLHLFKKLTFLTGRQHLYCMNYFLDEAALPLEDKNIYTAIEIRTLVPVSGQNALTQFLEANPWVSLWLPVSQSSPDRPPFIRASRIKQLVERLFNNRIGNALDNFLFKITSRRWQRKEAKGKRNVKGKIMGLFTGKHFARTNPEFFQEKVIAAYNRKLDELKLQHDENPPILSFVK